ncbi:uncharacterized protein LOC144115714, partial [Amblyomma americanum]
ILCLYDVLHFSIGVFASSGNVKSQMLSKIVLEATVLCEQAGLLVHYVCTDGATWNRSMWHNLGVYGNGKNVKGKVTHPCDEDRFLHFISDFPHLAKCVRNTLLKQGLNTHLGRAHWEHVSTMWKLDNNSMTLKVAPKLTRSHIYPNGFDKMCLSFYSLARSPKDGNVSPDVLESLLSVEEVLAEKESLAEDSVKPLPIDAMEVAADHRSYAERHSDARLIYYISGYVARKRVLTTH